MKTVYTIAAFLLLLTSYGQSYYNLEMNNVRATLSDGGVLFSNGGTSSPGYEVPVGSGSHGIFSMGFWMAGQDISAQLHSSYGLYPGSTELFPGPISDDYNSSYYTTDFLTSMWTLSKVDVDNHMANYTNGGYVVPNSIATWPGNGNTSEGVAAVLAPYIDFNSNGTYDPANGDYPYIEGDQATFIILNDENGTHAVAAGQTIGAEVHLMVYQFATSDDLNNTTFFHVNVYNRRSTTLTDFRFGVFTDFDLGNPQDDYWGSDSARNYMFAYNADNIDEAGSGASGYGSNPPALGVVSLSHNLDAAISYSSSPSTGTEFYNLLSGVQANGAPYVHLDGYDTKFQHSEDPDSSGYNEVDLGNPMGDRRGMMSLAPITLAPNDNLCMDYAVVYHRDLTMTNVENAQGLDGVVDFVQNYFDNNIEPCAYVNVGVTEEKLIDISIYPNPSNGILNLELDGVAQVVIVDLSGKKIYEEYITASQTTIDLSQFSGIFVLQAITDQGSTSQKIYLK